MSDIVRKQAGEILGDNTGGIKFDTQQFAFGQRISITTDATSTQVLKSVIDQLSTVPGDLVSILGTLFGGKTKQPYKYDPSAKWLAGIAVTYSVVNFDILLVDGQFYGLLIKIGKKPKPKPPKPPEGADEKDGDEPKDDQPFAGLELEIIYRKINDHLGEFSADLTLPSKYRKIVMGKAPEATTITLPSIGLAIWTNGDFKVSIGWPLGQRSFNIAFPPNPIPWAGGGGLYFARLRSEDASGLGTDFDTIIEFGIGLRIGAATDGEYGILEWEASIYLFGTFQGMLAWRTGHSISDGVDYYWFAATIGITGSLEGTVDFVIIKVTVSLELTAQVGLAIETEHQTLAIAEFSASVTAKVTFLFFTVRFSFSLDVSVDVKLGSGATVAELSGPTPPSSLPLAVRSLPPALPRPTRILAAPAPLAVDVHLLLQPSIRFDEGTNAWQPVGVASVIIDRPAPGVDGGADGFSQLVASLASYVCATYGGYTDPTAPLTAAELTQVQQALAAGRFDLTAIYAWLNGSQVSFAITAVTTKTNSGPVEGAVLPMIPGLVLTYDGVETTFGDTAAPPAYVTLLAEYFAKLSIVGDGSVAPHALDAFLAAPPPPASAAWFPGVVFADYFGLIAKQLTRDLAGLTTTGTLAQALTQVDLGNLAGTGTRFLQHGLRVPDPAHDTGPIETLPLLGLFQATGQQFDVASDGKGGYNLDAVVSVGAPSIAVKVVDGAAELPFALDQAPGSGPLWSPQPLARLNDAPLVVLLRSGIAWSEQTPTATNRWLVFALPDPLQAQLRADSPLTLQLSTIDNSGATAPVPGMQGLLIRFSVSPITAASPGGEAVPGVFDVSGTDEETRDLIELLFTTGALDGMTLDLLLPQTDGSWSTSTADAQALLVKTNLSTLNKPNLSALFADAEGAAGLPPLGPTTASISNATDFLRLLWECSVVGGGGFFLNVSDLKPGTATKIDVAVLVRPTSGATSPALAVDAFHNAIVVAATNVGASSRVQAAVLDQDGTTPVTVAQPNYPAGTLAFGATWTATDSPPVPSDAVAANTTAYAESLYQLLQFQLQPDSVLDLSCWSMPLGPDGTDTTWSYRRAVPVQRFVKGAGSQPNRYAAIGHSATVDLALVDVFGNAVGVPPLELMAVYNDPLVAVDEWPATTAAYAFTQGTGGTATLTVTVTFQPTHITDASGALPVFATVYDQLTDPRTSVSVTSCLADGPIALTTSTGAGTQQALSEFVGQIVAYLQPQQPGPAPASITLTAELPIAYATEVVEDLFPLWVELELSRSAPTETTPFPYPDGYLSVTTQVPLELAEGATDAAALRQWSLDFEKSFAGFDGAGGLLKVLAGRPPTQLTLAGRLLGATPASAVTSSAGNVWALRWGGAGLDVTFPNAGGSPAPAQAPVYFTPLPLSTQLEGGQVDVVEYDGNGTPQPPVTTQFTSIDLDLWARSFLQAFDGLLTPEAAAAIARVDQSQYAALTSAKQQVANAAAADVSWVFVDQMPTGKAPGAGDVTTAQETLEQNLLTALSGDYSTSAIVQAPAAVTVQGPFESAAAQPAQLFGSPMSNPTGSTTLDQHTISTATLPVVSGQGYLSFLVGVVNPTSTADLCLTFAYDIGFIEHQFQTGSEAFGYEPSSWLRVVVPDVDPSGSTVLDVPMGTLDIPVPIRAYPTPPRLVRQWAQATNPAAKTVADALFADYSLTIVSPTVAQDDVHIALSFNGAKIDRHVEQRAGGTLFDALARFTSFQANNLPTAMTAILSGGANAASWLGAVVTRVQDVATAWATPSHPTIESDAAGLAPLPAPFTWDFVLQVPDESQPGNVLLRWDGDGSPPASAWPTIEGVHGTPTQQPNEYAYTLSGSADTAQPTLTWPGLAVVANQSISAYAWIVRNETLAGCGGKLQSRETNPGLIYSTTTVSFGSPVIPLLEVADTLTIADASLGEALTDFLNQVLPNATPPTQIGVGIEVGYELNLVEGPSGQRLRTQMPVFLVQDEISNAGSAPQGVQTPAQLVAALQAALTKWYGDFSPSVESASLRFTLTIFAAGSRQPLARLQDVEAPVSGAGWWTG